MYPLSLSLRQESIPGALSGADREYRPRIIYFSDHIVGPVQGLWLDRSEVKGKLHWMKAAKSGEQTNVCLVWEGVDEVRGEKTFCQYWRILVVVTRHIMPFDQLVRPA